MGVGVVCAVAAPRKFSKQITTDLMRIQCNARMTPSHCVCMRDSLESCPCEYTHFVQMSPLLCSNTEIYWVQVTALIPKFYWQI